MNNILQAKQQLFDRKNAYSNRLVSSFYKPKFSIKWQQVLTRVLVWLMIEIYLDFIGLDTLADYSEFIFDKNTIIHLV